MQSRFQAFQSSGATQISSDMMFGNAESATANQSSMGPSLGFSGSNLQENLQTKGQDALNFMNNMFSRLTQAGNLPGQ